MGGLIEDGTGFNGFLGVDFNNRVLGFNEERTFIDMSAEVGDRYNINTGKINITAANDTPILYIKNNSLFDMVVTSVVLNLGANNGSGDGFFKIEKNVSSATFITNAVPASAKSNMNHGTNKIFNFDTYIGDDTDTWTGGSAVFDGLINSGVGRHVISNSSMVLPKGASMTVIWKPPAGNSDQDVNAAAAIYFKSKDVAGIR